MARALTRAEAGSEVRGCGAPGHAGGARRLPPRSHGLGRPSRASAGCETVVLQRSVFLRDDNPSNIQRHGMANYKPLIELRNRLLSPPWGSHASIGGPHGKEEKRVDPQDAHGAA